MRCDAMRGVQSAARVRQGLRGKEVGRKLVARAVPVAEACAGGEGMKLQVLGGSALEAAKQCT